MPVRRLIVVSAALFVAVLGWLLVSDSAEAAPVTNPKCLTWAKDARYSGYGYDHSIKVTNACPRIAACTVSTSSNPDIMKFDVPAGGDHEYVAKRGSPAREFTATVECIVEMDPQPVPNPDPVASEEGFSVTAAARQHRVTVHGVPPWIDTVQLLGPGPWSDAGTGTLTADLERSAAAQVVERLRGLGLGGRPLHVTVVPPLPRSADRQARLVAARERRHRTPGFLRAGAETDAEGRLSLTPEALALDLAHRAPGPTVVDAFAGVGGNAIAFARAGLTVTALEINPSRLDLARRNAALYGVGDAVRFSGGDAVTLLPHLSADLLFLDPPWGEHYDRIRTTAADLAPLEAALAVAPLERFPTVWLKAPPSFDPDTLPHVSIEALFGRAPGDAHRVKMLLVVLRGEIPRTMAATPHAGSRNR